jgi:FkbM family methyltransferase
MDLQTLLAQEDRSAIEMWVKKQTQSSYLGDRRALCRVLGKYLMYVPGEDLSITPHLLLDGFWEMWTTMRVARFLKPGMRCIDVGANVGYFTILMADFVGAQGHVQAWEPNSTLTRLLARSLRVNGLQDRVKVLTMAALDGHRSIDLREETPDCLASVHVVPSERQPEVLSDQSFAYSLDAWNQDQVVDFVKVDAEGSEEKIWDGAADLRSRNPAAVWLVEFTPAKYPDPKAFLEKLGSEGRRLAAVGDNGELRPAPAAEVLAAPFTMLWVDRPA